MTDATGSEAGLLAGVLVVDLLQSQPAPLHALLELPGLLSRGLGTVAQFDLHVDDARARRAAHEANRRRVGGGRRFEQRDGLQAGGEGDGKGSDQAGAVAVDGHLLDGCSGSQSFTHHANSFVCHGPKAAMRAHPPLHRSNGRLVGIAQRAGCKRDRLNDFCQPSQRADTTPSFADVATRLPRDLGKNLRQR